MFRHPESIKALAADGVFVGTSSWKYPGWLGQLYSEERYLTRGKFSEAKFNRSCLAEYAETFPTVCVDAAFYTFPTVAGLTGLAELVPANFRFGFKVTDAITVHRYPNLPKHGPMAGKVNPRFLDADLFQQSFLTPMESIRPHVGPIIFEFSHFHPGEFDKGRDFIAALDGFLTRIPRGWQYAVEIRNKTFLHPDYFAMLHGHGVAHCFNSWERMPPVSEQMTHPGIMETADFLTGRFLLTPGRKYQAAVDAFSPYTETKAPDPDARDAARRLIAQARGKMRQLSFFFFNNRLEGNALNTISAVTGEPPPGSSP